MPRENKKRRPVFVFIAAVYVLENQNGYIEDKGTDMS